jgi:hypothetical protein
MKTLSALVVGLAIALSAQAAGAYVIQVVTTVPVTAASAADAGQLGDVVQWAIRDVLDHAIAFTPTVVRIDDARVVGERLYLILLVADAEGEAAIQQLGAEESTGADGAQDDDTGAPEVEHTSAAVRAPVTP